MPYSRLKKTICAWIAILAIVCSTRPFQVLAAGTSYQVCKTAANCTVGEYLYDDSYTPITSATCTLTSRNTDGTLYHSSVAMTSAAENDGWYSYTFDTTGKAEGIYRAQVCCTSGSDYLCLDKTFQISSTSAPTAAEVASTVWDTSVASHTVAGSFGANLQSPAPSASDIWNYSGRSLTTYGSLIADMWSYSGRSLTNFGTLIADIWSNATRTLTAGILSNGTHIATQEDVQLATDSAVVSIKGASNKDLTQVGTQVAGVQSTADTINGKVDTLTTSVGTLNTNISTILTKWGSYSAADILTAVNGVSTTIGTTLDTCSNNTVFGNAYCAKSKWGVETSSTLLTATNNVATTAAALRAELAYNGKSTTAYEDMQTLLTNLGTVSTGVGSVTTAISGVDTKVDAVALQVLGVQTTSNTINGKVDTLISTTNTINTTTSTGSAALATINAKLDSLGTKVDTLTTNVTTLLDKWGAYSASDIFTIVSSLQTSIGTNSDSCLSTSLFGYARCAKEKWGTATADDLLTATTTVGSTATALRNELAYNGKSTTAYEDLQTLLANLSSVSTNVNTVHTQVTGIDTKMDTVTADVLGISTQVSTVSAKIDVLTTKVDNLATSVSGVATNVTSLLSHWSTYTMSDVITKLTSLETSLGTSSNTCVDLTVFGYLTCVENNGGGGGGGNDAAILAAATAAAADAAALRTELDYNGKSTTAYADLQNLKSNITTMQTLIGGSSDASSATTLFGRIKDVRETIANLDTSGAGLSDLLAKWGDTSATEIYSKVKDLSEKIDAVNTVSDVSSILTLSKANADDMLVLKNKVLELRALTQLNKTLLQDGATKPVVQLWMEEGSIIFKTLITNPSSSSQSVPVKFYLPKEAGEKDIMKIDTELTAHYDPDQDAVYVGGNFTLASHQTKIVSIEVTDIWKVTDAELLSLRTQADELFKPLEKTSYFAQGSTLKSDITAALDTAKQVQADAKTPEARIKAYRDATSQVKRAKEDMASMKTLVTQAGSAGSLLGSVGGIQTVGTWGLIIILTTGFVFLALYMRLLTQQIQAHHAQPVKKTEAASAAQSAPSNKLAFVFPNIPPETRFIGMLLIAIVVAGLVIAIALKSNFLQSSRIVQPTPTPKVHEISESHRSPSPSPKSTERLVKALEKYGDSVNLREGPGKEFALVGTMKKGQSYPVLDTLTDKTKTVWLELSQAATKKAWVSSAFVEDVAQMSSTSGSGDVMLKDQKQVLGIATESNLPSYTINEDNVKLRIQPIPDFRFKMILSKGMRVTKIGEEKEWTNVEVSYQEGQSTVGIDGWVKTDYLDRAGL